MSTRTIPINEVTDDKYIFSKATSLLYIKKKYKKINIYNLSKLS